MATERQELRIAVRADVSGFFPNPPFTDESYTLYINRAIFEGLVKIDQKQQPTGVLAQRWDLPDERTWVFHLRPGRRFSDGRLVSPEDVVASLMAPRAHGWANQGDLAAIESARVAGSEQVEIHTYFPHPSFLYEVPWGFILPATATNASPVPTIGTGPYRLDSWTKGKEVRLSRNPHHPEPPAFETVRMAIVPDPVERARLLTAREVDFIDDVPPASAERLAKDPAFRVVSGPSARVLFLALRMDRPPFSDLRVRQAVDLAIDRSVLIDTALGGRGLPASQLVTSAIAGYDASIPHTRPDPERARKLLAEAGHAKGLSVTLDGPDNRYVGDAPILAEVARQLGQVGIQATVKTREKTDFYRHIETGESQGYLFGWACEVGDAAEVLNSVVHSKVDQRGTANFSHLADAELDRMIDESNRTPDPQKRTEIFSRAFRRVHELTAIVPLEIQVETFAHSTSVHWDPPMNMALELAQIRKR